MNLCDCMFIVAINDVNCDESGAIVASSCDMCPYEMFIDHYGNDFAHFYDPAIGGEFCHGPDCQWNVELDECQPKGIYNWSLNNMSSISTVFEMTCLLSMALLD